MASSLAARQATSILARLSSSRSASQAASFIQRRGLAGAADHHGPAKVNCWSDPMSPSKWKEEHSVIVSLSGCGLAIYGGYKLFSGGKKNNEILSDRRRRRRRRQSDLVYSPEKTIRFSA